MISRISRAITSSLKAAGVSLDRAAQHIGLARGAVVIPVVAL